MSRLQMVLFAVVSLVSLGFIEHHFYLLSDVQDPGNGFLTSAKTFTTLIVGLGVVEVLGWLGLFFIPSREFMMQKGLIFLSTMAVIGAGFGSIVASQMVQGLENQAGASVNQPQFLLGIVIHVFSTALFMGFTIHYFMEKRDPSWR